MLGRTKTLNLSLVQLPEFHSFLHYQKCFDREYLRKKLFQSQLKHLIKKIGNLNVLECSCQFLTFI